MFEYCEFEIDNKAQKHFQNKTGRNIKDQVDQVLINKKVYLRLVDSLVLLLCGSLR